MKVGVNLFVILVAVSTVGAAPPMSGSAEFGFGFPRGDMDISANGFFTLAQPVGEYWQVRATLHESLAVTRKDSQWLGMNATAGYLLARLGCDQPWRGFAPFAEVGGGLHVVISYASKDSPVNDVTNLVLTPKANGFLGAECSFRTDRFMSLRVRFTYPSDPVVDAVYLNCGIRF